MLVQIVTENSVKKIKPLTADVGAGNPVGSIIVVCSNILPSGYLGLGVQYDITNYPALYQVLGTDTTPTASALGLPTLSSGQYAIKATSGLAENQQENVLNAVVDKLNWNYAIVSSSGSLVIPASYNGNYEYSIYDYKYHVSFHGIHLGVEGNVSLGNIATNYSGLSNDSIQLQNTAIGYSRESTSEGYRIAYRPLPGATAL